MSKDPAFLFYTNDFLSGTMFMTDDQVGKYVRLLCAQHQHGHLTQSQMRSLCGGNADQVVFEKFEVDNEGKFFNGRLDNEIKKRAEHSEQQRNNAFKRWKKDNPEPMPPQCDGIATAMPLENRNEDIINSSLNGGSGGITYEQFHDDFYNAAELKMDAQRKYNLSDEQYYQLLDEWLSDRKISRDWNFKDVDGKLVPRTGLDLRKHLNNFIRRKFIEQKKEKTNGKRNNHPTLTEAIAKGYGVEL